MTREGFLRPRRARPPLARILAPAPGGGSFAELSTSLAERQRARQLVDVLDLLEEPTTARLVGPIDLSRVAVGGHSYGGSAAFNASLADPRIAAVVDLDGSLFHAAGSTPTTVPSLLVMATILQVARRPVEPDEGPDLQLARLTIEVARTNPNVVAVGLEGADHYDVTDVPVIAAALPPGLGAGGPIGPAGTRATSTLVRRFLVAALGTPARRPAAAELIEGLAAATAVPFR